MEPIEEQNEQLKILPGPPAVLRHNPLVGASLSHKNLILYLMEHNVEGYLIRTLNREMSDYEHHLEASIESSESFISSFH